MTYKCLDRERQRMKVYPDHWQRNRPLHSLGTRDLRWSESWSKTLRLSKGKRAGVRYGWRTWGIQRGVGRTIKSPTRRRYEVNGNEEALVFEEKAPSSGTKGIQMWRAGWWQQWHCETMVSNRGRWQDLELHEVDHVCFCVRGSGIRRVAECCVA